MNLLKIEALRDIDSIETSEEFTYTYISEEEIEAIINQEVTIELEKKQIKNMSEKTALISELISKDTKVIYPGYVRPKFEMYAGFKRAKERQTIINLDMSQIKTFNLTFKFINEHTNALEATAMMIRKNGEEIILLLPDNTKERVEAEKEFYIGQANKLTLPPKFKMDPDEHSILIENLNELNDLERCAQSLLHEYGHVIHWRIFHSQGIRSNADIYKWFYYSGYADLMDRRSPEYHKTEDVMQKVYLLKESLVEDYRIWLNMEHKNDMFILPNVNTFLGDFCEPSLLQKGVSCMKKMFNSYIKQKGSTGITDYSFEPNRVARGKEIVRSAQNSNWEPGKASMTTADHLAIIKQLEETEHKNLELV